MKTLHSGVPLLGLLFFIHLPLDAALAQGLFQTLSHTREVKTLVVHDDKLWVGTTGGLDVYDKRGQKHAAYGAEDGLLGNGIHDLRIEDGALLVACEGGVVRFVPETGNFEEVRPEGNPRFMAPRFATTAPDVHPLQTHGAVDHLGNTWQARASGEVIRMRKGKKRAFMLPGSPLAALPRRGGALIPSTEGLFYVDAEGVLHQRLKESILSYVQRADGRVILGLEDGRILEETSTLQYVDTGHGFPSKGISALAIFGGRLAIGLEEDGIHWRGRRLDDPSGLCGNMVVGLSPYKKGLAIATFDRGVCVQDQSGRFSTYRAPRKLGSDLVNRIGVDGDNLWVGTSFGVTRIRHGKARSYAPGYKNAFLLSGYGVVGIAPTQDHLFFADGKGVSRIGRGKRGKRHRYRNLPGLSEKITQVVSAGSEVWAATEDRGMSRFDGNEWIRHDVTHGLAEEWVVTAAAAEDGRAWAGHSERGISFFDGLRWQIIDEESGLIDGGLLALHHLVPEDLILAGTLGGLSVIDGQSGRVCASYSVSDGLADRRVHAITANDTRIFLGTEGGISITTRALLRKTCE